ncbi:MAG: MBL fold metallo-hydrolase, partial [Nitrospirota bacterium]
MEMIFRQLNPHACRTYLLGSEGSKEVTIIDPVLEHLNDYLKLLETEKMQLAYVIDTHTHADHISGAAALKDHTGCDYLMHARAPACCVTSHLKEGFMYLVKGIPIKVMYTPGHTKDSLSLIFQDRLLTGDVLFLEDGGAGRDDLPGGDPGEHWDSLQRILGLPDHLIVYPAHEYRNRQSSSLAVQKLKNPHLKPATREDYIRYVEDLKFGPADWMKEVLKANYACARDPKTVWVPVDVSACEVKGTIEHGVNDQMVSNLSPEEVKRRLDEGYEQILLDVRELNELEGELGHLPEIRHIPIDSLSGRISDLEVDIDKDIITICRSGGRAHTAAQILMQAGFSKVYVLAGGMTAWNKAGYLVTNKV